MREGQSCPERSVVIRGAANRSAGVEVQFKCEGQSCPGHMSDMGDGRKRFRPREVSIEREGHDCPAHMTRFPGAHEPVSWRRRRITVPRLSTATKTKRDTGIVAGLPALLAPSGRADIRGGPFAIDALRAMFEKHLRAMAKVRELTIARRQAVQEERAVEASLRPVIASLKLLAHGRAGKYGARLRALGFEPEKKPTMSVATKVAANVKRQATRKERGIVGKKRRGRRAR